ncbi:MAG: hypothetical protein CR977_00005 [Gammaproteobacteria bacterium]|nr:MAG: hypothetical protein CR977_00005 [Gammaproteobacteria bacterium]
MKTYRLPPCRQRGIALLTVLTMMAVLMLLAANYVLTVSRDTESIDTLNLRIQARYSAFSGIQYALFAMQDRDKEVRWTTDGKLYSVELAGGQVHARIMPESGRLDINVARPPLLRLLFEYAGADEEQAIQLTDNVMHWRNRQDMPVGNSVMDADYESAGLPLPAHRRFYAIEELAKVHGVTAAMYQRVKTLITVYGSNKINGLVAGEAMFLLLQLEPDAIAAIHNARDAYYADETPISPDVRGLSPFLTYNTRAGYYRVLAYATTADGHSEAVYSIIKNQRGRDGAYREMARGTVTGEARKQLIQAVQTAQQ